MTITYFREKTNFDGTQLWDRQVQLLTPQERVLAHDLLLRRQQLLREFESEDSPASHRTYHNLVQKHKSLEEVAESMAISRETVVYYFHATEKYIASELGLQAPRNHIPWVVRDGATYAPHLDFATSVEFLSSC